MKHTDLNYLKNLSRGNNAFVIKIINKTIEQVSDALPKMEQQFATKDWESLSNLMHKMKPCLEIMGIHTLKKTMITIEESTSEDVDLENIEEINNMLEKVKIAFEDLIIELEAEKQSLILN